MSFNTEEILDHKAVDLQGTALESIIGRVVFFPSPGRKLLNCFPEPKLSFN